MRPDGRAKPNLNKPKIEFDQNREMADNNSVNRNLNLNLLLETLLLCGAAVGF